MTENFKTTIGLEIHVQLATKSKMFCRCDNNADNAKPNTLVCPVCLGLPGALPVANKTAIEWTFKTGLALNCKIPEIAKFDRKHYFYPDLPKGYQISQYDEPFCKNGHLEIDGEKIRINRIHLEEDAGKLLHKNGKSLVDLNRAGTPLMEIVTEPDITTPTMAGDFLRKLQKIVRDVVEVSEASMEKGHLRCDANVSVTRNGEQGTGNKERMSQIIEIKNLNSFRFVEKALIKAVEKLQSEYEKWPAKMTKETWGYNSDTDSIFLQRAKEEAADYRYFPEPDLPLVKSAEFDLENLRNSAKETHEEVKLRLEKIGISPQFANILASDKTKQSLFNHCHNLAGDEYAGEIAKAIVQNTFLGLKDYPDELITVIFKNIGKYPRNVLLKIVGQMLEGSTFDEAKKTVEAEGGDSVEAIIDKIISDNPAEVERYRNGDAKLLGFFVGQTMRETKGSADPQVINRILKERL